MIRRYSFASIALLGLTAASCLPLVDSVDQDLAGRELRLTILHTSDIHSRLVPYDYAPLKTDVDLGIIPEAGPFGGAARLAALIKRERAKADRVIHLDSGDAFQGAPIYNVNNGEAEFKWLSSIRLDAAVVGNHEFDSGALNFANQARDSATFPLLAANYVWSDPKHPDSHQSALYTSPYTIKNVGGVRVGVIGMANISSLNSIVEGGNSLQITPLEQNEVARSYVELLKPLTDLIVIVSHLGLTEDQDLVQGYEAYYEYERAQPFINRVHNPWVLHEWFGPQGEPKSVVRVHIPGVSGIDAVMGGHLHVVLNPPQLLTDPSGRKVVLAHSGSFAKFLGRLDLVVRMPPESGDPEGAEVHSHDYQVFPVDGLWCSESMHAYYNSRFWEAGQFIRDPQVIAALKDCTEREDKDTTQLLQPYIVALDYSLSLTSLFAYAPRDIARRNNSTGGDSPLGNLTADSMRKRRRVEAEVAVTNSLGIRDNLYAGPLTQEAMFNVFPFENTINVMYLSGREMQELFDFITDRSASRGCVSQAQISGARFVMDCAQSVANDLEYRCDPNAAPEMNGQDCPSSNRQGRAPWQCLATETGGRCWAHTGIDIQINGKPLEPNATYRIAVNDYIAKGGSGFTVLKRNTTRVETGIPLRDSLIGYLQGFCNCTDLLAGARDALGNLVGSQGQICGELVDGKWTVATQEVAYCMNANAFSTALNDASTDCSCAQAFRGNGTGCAAGLAGRVAQCLSSLPPGPHLGKCGCRDTLAGIPGCGALTLQTRALCENPMPFAIASGLEDGRIGRRAQ